MTPTPQDVVRVLTVLAEVAMTLKLLHEALPKSWLRDDVEDVLDHINGLRSSARGASTKTGTETTNVEANDPARLEEAR